MKKLNQDLTHHWLKKPPFCSAVIAAAGSGIRCKGEDKLLYKIHGKPVLVYTIEAFEKCSFIREIIITARQEQLAEYGELCKQYGLEKVSKIIMGGETRTISVYNGVFAVSKKAKYIAIHDGARPCVDEEVITKTMEKAVLYHAAAPGIPVVPTLKKAKMHGNPSRKKPNHTLIITDTIDRDGLYEIQTPQIFKTEIIKAALTRAVDKGIPLTDECMAVEQLNMPVHISAGSKRNIKITEPDDLIIAEALLDCSAE